MFDTEVPSCARPCDLSGAASAIALGSAVRAAPSATAMSCGTERHAEEALWTATLVAVADAPARGARVRR
jgi:hypothetical protein